MSIYARSQSNQRLQSMRGGGSVAPPQANLQLWLSGDKRTFTDASLTTPTSAPGDTVGSWGSRVAGTTTGAANGVGATYRPELSVSLNSRPALAFDGIADYMPLTASANGLKFIHETGIFEVVLVFRKDTTLRCGLFSSLVSSSDQGFDCEFSTTGALVMILTRAGFVIAIKTTTTIFNVGQWYAVCIRGDGTNLSLSTDFSTFSAGDTSPAYGNLPLGTGDMTSPILLGSIGPTGSPTFRMDGAFAEVLVYDTALSVANRALVKNYIAGKYGTTLPRARRMANIGDSITQTAQARANVPWPNLLERYLGPSWCCGNFGVSGAQTAATSTLVTNSVVGKGYEESTVLIGVNDCVAGVDSAATIFARIYNGSTGIVDKLLADGQRVNLCTILPINNYASATPTIKTKITDINTSIKALNVANLKILDTYEHMGDTADATQLSYQGAGRPDCVTFQDGSTRDYLHLGPGGCDRLAKFILNNRTFV